MISPIVLQRLPLKTLSIVHRNKLLWDLGMLTAKLLWRMTRGYRAKKSRKAMNRRARNPFKLLFIGKLIIPGEQRLDGSGW